MSDNTHMCNRFEFWSVADCDCKLCRWHGNKKHPCLLDVCCCDDIRHEALLREQAATGGSQARNNARAELCRG